MLKANKIPGFINRIENTGNILLVNSLPLPGVICLILVTVFVNVIACIVVSEADKND